MVGCRYCLCRKRHSLKRGGWHHDLPRQRHIWRGGADGQGSGDVIGGSGKWSGATGKMDFRHVSDAPGSGKFTFQFEITMPQRVAGGRNRMVTGIEVAENGTRQQWQPRIAKSAFA